MNHINIYYLLSYNKYCFTFQFKPHIIIIHGCWLKYEDKQNSFNVKPLSRWSKGDNSKTLWKICFIMYTKKKRGHAFLSYGITDQSISYYVHVLME